MASASASDETHDAFATRPEDPSDYAAVRRINVRVFGGTTEADLVETLREEAARFLSLVAEENGRVIGHILFTPVEIVSATQVSAMGLAPMAVDPPSQRRGVGSALVRAGLDACRNAGVKVVIVLGHPEYYPRFGFRPAHLQGLRCAFEAPPEAFMVAELRAGALDDVEGLVRYHAAFDAVE